MVTTASAPQILGGNGYPAAAPGVRKAVFDGVLDKRLKAQEGQGDGKYLWGHLEGHLQPVAEAGPGQGQILFDAAQLVSEVGEVAVSAERVPGEVGEFQEQFAGPLGVGADEGRDGGQ